MKYLLVDDNPIDLLVNEKTIHNNVPGSEVVKCNSALDALEYLDKCGSRAYPGVILLDIRMPFMDGFDFLESLEQRCVPPGSFRIYMVSSSIDPADLQRARNHPMVMDFLEKPLNQADNMKIFETVCS